MRGYEDNHAWPVIGMIIGLTIICLLLKGFLSLCGVAFAQATEQKYQVKENPFPATYAGETADTIILEIPKSLITKTTDQVKPIITQKESIEKAKKKSTSRLPELKNSAKCTFNDGTYHFDVYICISEAFNTRFLPSYSSLTENASPENDLFLIIILHIENQGSSPFSSLINLLSFQLVDSQDRTFSRCTNIDAMVNANDLVTKKFSLNLDHTNINPDETGYDVFVFDLKSTVRPKGLLIKNLITPQKYLITLPSNIPTLTRRHLP